MSTIYTTIVEDLRRSWDQRRGEVIRAARAAGKKRYADAVEACALFRGDEGPEELLAKLQDPQAVEFLLRHGWPSVTECKLLGLILPVRAAGVYVGAGGVDIENAPALWLVDGTTGRLRYTEPGGYEVTLFHGARAEVDAAAGCVVVVRMDAASEVIDRGAGSVLCRTY